MVKKKIFFGRRVGKKEGSIRMEVEDGCWMEVVFEWQMLRALSFSNACFHVIFVVQREIMAPCCLTATRVREGGGGGPLPCKSSWRGDNMPRLSGWLTGRLASNSQLAVGKGGWTFVGGWVLDGEVATDLRLVLSSAMRLLGRFQRMKLPPPLFPLPPLSFILFLNSLLEIISSCSDLISMKLLLIAFFCQSSGLSLSSPPFISFLTGLPADERIC